MSNLAVVYTTFHFEIAKRCGPFWQPEILEWCWCLCRSWEARDPLSLAECYTISAIPPCNSGREKTHKHKPICGIVPGLGGCQFFFVFIPYGGEKHINKIPPKIPGQSRVNFVYVFFFLYVFFFSLPSNRGYQPSWSVPPKLCFSYHFVDGRWINMSWSNLRIILPLPTCKSADIAFFTARKRSPH